MTTQNALSEATNYDLAHAAYVAQVGNAPHHVIERRRADMEKILARNVAARVEIEADHQVRLDRIDDHFKAKKFQLEEQIKGLEAQLQIVRHEWTATCTDERNEVQRERDRWLAHDAGMAKLINADRVMIEALGK